MLFLLYSIWISVQVQSATEWWNKGETLCKQQKPFLCDREWGATDFYKIFI